jgi:hypothetical protein
MVSSWSSSGSSSASLRSSVAFPPLPPLCPLIPPHWCQPFFLWGLLIWPDCSFMILFLAIFSVSIRSFLFLYFIWKLTRRDTLKLYTKSILNLTMLSISMLLKTRISKFWSVYKIPILGHFWYSGWHQPWNLWPSWRHPRSLGWLVRRDIDRWLFSDLHIALVASLPQWILYAENPDALESPSEGNWAGKCLCIIG